MSTGVRVVLLATTCMFCQGAPWDDNRKFWSEASCESIALAYAKLAQPRLYLNAVNRLVYEGEAAANGSCEFCTIGPVQAYGPFHVRIDTTGLFWTPGISFSRPYLPFGEGGRLDEGTCVISAEMFRLSTDESCASSGGYVKELPADDKFSSTMVFSSDEIMLLKRTNATPANPRFRRGPSVAKGFAMQQVSLQLFLCVQPAPSQPWVPVDFLRLFFDDTPFNPTGRPRPANNRWRGLDHSTSVKAYDQCGPETPTCSSELDTFSVTWEALAIDPKSVGPRSFLASTTTTPSAATCPLLGRFVVLLAGIYLFIE